MVGRLNGIRAVADVTSNLNELNFYHRSNVFCTSVAVARSYQFKGFYPNQISVYILPSYIATTFKNTYMDGVVAPDGAGQGGSWVGLTWKGKHELCRFNLESIQMDRSEQGKA